MIEGVGALSFAKSEGQNSIKDRIEKVTYFANWIRRKSLEMVYKAGMGHPGGDLSSADILAAIYFDAMKYDSNNPTDPKRDRFVLSKGHITGAFYSVLAAAGYFPEEMLETYMQPLSKLNGHPNRMYLPGVETNTGPLGHGFPVGVGIAIAGQISNESYRTFVLTGDGELQEGSMWESAMLAGHRKLNSLTVIIDRNRLQQGMGTEDTVALEPLADRWRAFGWDVTEINGHNVSELIEVLSAPYESRIKPLCIIAHTVKGSGVSYMENKASWHHGVPNEEQFKQAMKELSL